MPNAATVRAKEALEEFNKKVEQIRQDVQAAVSQAKQELYSEALDKPAASDPPVKKSTAP
jgi:hypothetical protein